MFVNVKKRDLCNLSFDPDAPPYRYCWHGINLEGECQNRACEAHGKMVIHQHGYGNFDLRYNKAYCPLCHVQIVPLKPGFVNCTWRIHYMTSDQYEHRTPPKTVPEDKYQTYNLKTTGLAKFEFVSLEAAPPERVLTPKESKTPVIVSTRCPECCKELAPTGRYILPCGHALHQACVAAFKEHSSQCLFCDGSLHNILPPSDQLCF